MAVSPAGRARLIVAAMMAVTGALFFYGFLSDDLGNATAEQAGDVPASLIVRYIIAMALGGLLAGAAFAGLYGRSGLGGWVLALLGAVLASLIAGLIGSAIGLLPDLLADGYHISDLISVGFGLVLIPLSFAGRPYLFAVWLVLAVVTHLWARSARGRG